MFTYGPDSVPIISFMNKTAKFVNILDQTKMAQNGQNGYVLIVWIIASLTIKVKVMVAAKIGLLYTIMCHFRLWSRNPGS